MEHVNNRCITVKAR